MSALQQIYVVVTLLLYAGPALDALHAELMSLQPVDSNPIQDAIALN